MADAASSSGDDEDAFVPRAPVMPLFTLGLAAASDASDSEDGGESQGCAPSPTGPALTPTTPTDPSLLPSASDALGADDPSFLRVEGPDFDASAGFRPPPTALAPCVDYFSVGARAHEAAEELPVEAGEQRCHDNEYRGWRRLGQVRLQGSKCVETDDERGRRVRYGAHAMLQADPWSACNPNYSMRDVSVTRGKDRGVKRASNT